MLTTFGNDMDISVRKMLLACTGVVISVFVLFLAINIIYNGMKQLKNYKEKNKIKNTKPIKIEEIN